MQSFVNSLCAYIYAPSTLRQLYERSRIIQVIAHQLALEIRHSSLGKPLANLLEFKPRFIEMDSFEFGFGWDDPEEGKSLLLRLLLAWVRRRNQELRAHLHTRNLYGDALRPAGIVVQNNLVL